MVRIVAAPQSPSTVNGVLVSPQADLVALSSPSAVQTPEALLVRLRQLEVALRGDGRVVFPAVYVAITKAAVKLIADGGLKDAEKGRALIVDFGQRYLHALHAQVTGGSIPAPWQRHFELATEGPPSLRAAASAINAHLSIDLAEALVKVEAGPAFKQDFAVFGDSLASATPAVIDGLARHGVNAEGFFRGWWIGAAVDAIVGQGTTSRFGFQVIRAEAFANALLLQQCSEHPRVVRAGMSVAAHAREASLDAVLGPC
jgi:hypothetical protein